MIGIVENKLENEDFNQLSEVLPFQDLIPPQNDSLHVHVETYIFEISKIGEWVKYSNMTRDKWTPFTAFKHDTIQLRCRDSWCKIRWPHYINDDAYEFTPQMTLLWQWLLSFTLTSPGRCCIVIVDIFIYVVTVQISIVKEEVNIEIQSGEQNHHQRHSPSMGSFR